MIRLLHAAGALVLLLVPALSQQSSPHNVLVVLIDDLGVETLEQYAVTGGENLPTPHIDEFLQEGTFFANAYAHPVCSPTRAALLTGRHAFRTGMGDVLERSQQPKLAEDEVLLPELLSLGVPGLYSTLALGKWHLSRDANNVIEEGFQQYHGAPWSLGGPMYCPANGPSSCAAAAEQSYSCFCKYHARQGKAAQRSRRSAYATTDSIDDAVRFITTTGDQPWFVYLSLHAPHGPWSAPPANLFQVTPPPVGAGLSEAETRRLHFEAMVEALDTELGRLKQSLDPTDTTVFLLSDNGTSSQVVGPPFARTPTRRPRAKNTVYQGGVNVPFIVWGADVAPSNVGRLRRELIEVLDLYSTIAEIAGVPDPAAYLPSDHTLDSVSFLPILQDNPDPERLREFAYSERFDDGSIDRNFHRTIRDQRFKLIQRSTGPDEFYDLQNDRWEDENLLDSPATMADAEIRARYEALQEAIQHLLES